LEKQIKYIILFIDSPRVEEEISPIFVPSLGEEAVVSLNISGNPQPSIEWLVDGETIRPRQASKDRRYTALELVKRGVSWKRQTSEIRALSLFVEILKYS
jgi:hypothetical protein